MPMCGDCGRTVPFEKLAAFGQCKDCYRKKKGFLQKTDLSSSEGTPSSPSDSSYDILGGKHNGR